MNYLSRKFIGLYVVLLAVMLATGASSVWAQDAVQESPWGPPNIRPLPNPNNYQNLEELPFVNTDELLVGPEPVPPPKNWDFSLEWGLSGTNGNSETFNFRTGSHIKRTVPGTVFTLDLDYKRDSANSFETANRAFVEGRNDWEFDDSPWTCFLHSTFEYDEFKAYDSRVAMDAGFGYAFFDNNAASLKGRLGAGVSREIGGPDNSYVPEAVFGLAYEREVSDRQRFSAGVDYFPSWEDYNDFRANSRISWEFILDEASNLSLKIAATDRYDSTPNGARRNDVDYSTLLIWKY